MDKLSMAIIAMEAHIACSNERLRQAWEIIHAKLVEENGSSHNKQSKTVTIACTCGKRSATVHLCEQCFEDAVTA